MCEGETIWFWGVWRWKPDEVIDDNLRVQLDNDLGFEGMKEEIVFLAYVTHIFIIPLTWLRDGVTASLRFVGNLR